MKKYIFVCIGICLVSSQARTNQNKADHITVSRVILESTQAASQNYALTKQLLKNTYQVLSLCKKQIEAIKKRSHQKNGTPTYIQQQILEGQTRLDLVTSQLENAETVYKNTGRAIVQYLVNRDLYTVQQRNAKGLALIKQYQSDFAHIAQVLSKAAHATALHVHLYADNAREARVKIEFLANELGPQAQLLAQQVKIAYENAQLIKQATHELQVTLEARKFVPQLAISEAATRLVATQIRLISAMEKNAQQLRNEITACAKTIDRCRRGLCAIQVMLPSDANAKTAQVGYSGLVKYLEEHVVTDLADKYQQLKTLQKAAPKQRVDASSLTSLRRSAKKIADKIEPVIKNLRTCLSSLTTIGALDTAAYALAEKLRQKYEPPLNATLVWLNSPEYGNAVHTLSSQGIKSGLTTVSQVQDLDNDVKQNVADAQETLGVITRALAILARVNQ